MYAVGLHDIEESLLSHTVLFLKNKEKRELFLMCSSEWKITFLCPIEHSQNQYSKSNLENPKKRVFFPGKLGYRDPDHPRTKILENPKNVCFY